MHLQFTWIPEMKYDTTAREIRVPYIIHHSGIHYTTGYATVKYIFIIIFNPDCLASADDMILISYVSYDWYLLLCHKDYNY